MSHLPESTGRHCSCRPVPANRDRPDCRKPDIVRSAGMYRDWLMRSASEAGQGARVQVAQDAGKTSRP
ncbi:MAG: hypothetical protein OXD44_05010 [Gammaproteobacteria bacterium]|nr:hypothetical protein [Gammaproteobacteria bacterium]